MQSFSRRAYNQPWPHGSKMRGSAINCRMRASGAFLGLLRSSSNKYSFWLAAACSCKSPLQLQCWPHDGMTCKRAGIHSSSWSLLGLRTISSPPSDAQKISKKSPRSTGRAGACQRRLKRHFSGEHSRPVSPRPQPTAANPNRPSCLQLQHAALACLMAMAAFCPDLKTMQHATWLYFVMS